MRKVIIGILIWLFLFSTYVYADSSVLSNTSLKERLTDAVALYIGSSKALVNNSFTQVDSTNPGVGPIVKNDRTLVPVRFISERFGADVKWDDSTSTATITTQDRVAKITTESSKMIVNGDEIVLDVPAEKIQNRLFIPLRKLVEDVLNKKVFYDSGLIIISDNENIMDKNSEAESISELIMSFEPNTLGASSSVEDGLLLPASTVTIDGQKWGYIDEHAQFKIQPQYDGVEEFNKAGIAVAFNYTGKEKYSYGDKNIYVIDKTGKKLFGPQKAKEYL
ncbi:MAG TPA: stalk domain-containing protein, partial [Clostridia bacterium]